MAKKMIPRKGWDRLRQDLNSRTSIGRKELTELVKKYLGVSVDYAAWRLLAEGVLARPTEKGRRLYVVVHQGSTARHILDPIEAIRSVYGTDVVFCYGTALYLHGLSRYGRLLHYYVVTEGKPSQKELGQITVRSVRAKMEDKKGITR